MLQFRIFQKNDIEQYHTTIHIMNNLVFNGSKNSSMMIQIKYRIINNQIHVYSQRFFFHNLV